MGSCMSSVSRSNSKMELSDANSNIFRVTNIDDNGVALWNGQLGLSRTEITLYRKNLEPTRWPLKCLRRYGYDTELFSFEVGRRCATGEGIYAFKCRRAETLFQTLQSYIQMSSTSVGDDPLGHLPNSNSTLSRESILPISALTNQNQTSNSMIGSYILPNSRPPNTMTLRNLVNEEQRRSLDTSDSNYLEPVIGANINRTLTRFHSMGDGTVSSLSMEPLSPGSPNSLSNILEATPLNPLPTNALNNNNGVSNVYHEFQLRGGSSNNNKENTRENCVKKLSLDIPPQEYAPTAVGFASHIDAATLHSTILANANQFNGNQTLSTENLPHSLPISPTQSNDASDATIPTYVNVTPGEISSTASTPKVLIGDYKSQIYRNNINNNNYLVDPTHCYENFEPSEVRPILLRNQNQNRRLSRTEMLSKNDSILNSPTIISESIISEPTTPNNGGVNYIVLDLDQSHSQPTVSASSVNANPETVLSSNSSPVKNPNAMMVSNTMSPSVSASTTTHSVSSLLLPDSPQRKAFDYVTIDFNKTNALSNSIAPTTECEGLRKTRHSSNIPPAVNANTPSSHSNSVSD